MDLLEYMYLHSMVHFGRCHATHVDSCRLFPLLTFETLNMFAY